MPKSLKLYNNRKTTLQFGKEVYHGRVLREEVGKAVNRDGRVHKTFSYYFQTDEGRAIEISKETVIGAGLGLISKLKEPFFKGVH